MKYPSLQKFIDYLLLNAYSVNSTGLYNGKAGLSLVLFEVGSLLDNKCIKEHAFELIQEALTTKNSDIGFENGLSGVGFTLQYLIKHHFVDADFQEVFGDKLQTIRETIYEAYAAGINMEAWVTIAYFLKDRQIVDCLVDRLYNQLYALLTGPLLSSPQRIKTDIFHRFRVLIRVLFFAGDESRLTLLLQTYIQAYRRGLIPTYYDIGYYAWKCSLVRTDSTMSYFAIKSMDDAVKDCYPRLLSLSQCINWSYLLRKDSTCFRPEVQMLEEQLIASEELKLEQKLSGMIAPFVSKVGYEGGIARWVLYMVFVRLLERREDVSRFDELFG